MTASAQYPIRAVARLTGLSVDTLRAWERRYQAVVPIRNDRGRVYSDRHVARLKQLAGLVAAGHQIGSIAGLTDAALRALQADARPESGSGHLSLDLEPLLLALRQYDVPAIEAIVNRHALVLPPAEFVFGVILPVMRAVGDRWSSGTVSVAHEHLISGVMRSVLGGLLRAMPAGPTATRLVFATIAGERHELGLLCAAVLAATAGYSVVYLGPDLPADDIAHAVVLTKASTLVLAATSPEPIPAVQIRRLKRLPDRVAIWVGGSQSESMRTALGARARHVASLDELRGLLDRHAA